MAHKIRTTTRADFSLIRNWWTTWEGGPAAFTLDDLPNDGLGGLMLERDGIPIAAIFMWLTNSKMGYLGSLVRDPDNKLTDEEGVELGLQGLKQLKKWGCTSILQTTKHDKVIEKSKEYGFTFSKREFANGYIRL